MTKRQIRCQRARGLLPAYADGSLTLYEREQLEAHLAACPLCSEELRNQEQLDVRVRVALRSAVDDHTLSSSREAQIRRRLLAASSAQRRWPRWSLSSAVAAIAAVLLVISAGIATVQPTPPPGATPGFVSYGPAGQEPFLFGEGGRSSLQPAPVTITFLDPTLPESAYTTLIDNFQAANTDVTVELYRPTTALTDPGMLAPEGDCFVASADISSAFVRDQLRPITRYAQADAQIRTDDFFPGLLDLVQMNDQLYGLPRTAQLRLAFFDTATLQRKGVALPSNQWTSDELFAKVQRLRQQLPDTVYAFIPFDGYDAAYLLTQRGARAPHAGDVRLATATTTDAVNWYAGLVHSADLVPLALNDPPSIARRQWLVANGQAAIWIAPPVVSHKLSPNVGIVPLPGDPEQPGALQADAYFISNGASPARAGACWRWIRYLSFQTFEWERVPARSSQVATQTFTQRFGQRQTNVIVQALSRTTPIDAWTPTTVAALTDAIDDVVLRGASARNALLRVQRYLESEW